MADFQKSKCYAWQQQVVFSQDKFVLTLDQAQQLVDFVWANQGRANPPRVETTKSKRWCYGNRTKIRLNQHGFYTCVVLHELAHSLDFALDEKLLWKHHGHGPNFMKIYINLLVKYMKLDLITLLHTAKQFGLKVAA